MQTFSTPAVAEAGKAVALAVVLTLVVGFMPLVGLLVMPALPLPLAYVTLRRGVSVGVAGAIGTGVLTAFTGLSNGLLGLLLAGAVGVLVGWVMLRGWGMTRALLITGGGAAAAFAAYAGLLFAVTGASVDQLVRTRDESLDAASALYLRMGMDQAVVDQAVQSVRASMEVLPYLLPAIVAVSGVFLAAVVLALAAVVFPHVGETRVRRLAFAEFRLHWSLAYGFIVGLGCMLVAPSLGGWEEVTRFVGWNLLIIAQALFFLQGLAVVHWITVTRRMTTGGRVAAYGVAVVGQLLIQLTSWAGLLDTWVDYRRRFAPPPPADDPAAPSGQGTVDREE